ncbi:hemin uptake protein HemP [Flavimaribacter sediminis]|nr:hemin uptake protein HemP [Flavimaribacter sediminis]
MTSEDTENCQERETTEEGRMRILNSRDLFKGASELCIEHGESVYRLRITRQGKLILNK